MPQLICPGNANRSEGTNLYYRPLQGWPKHICSTQIRRVQDFAREIVGSGKICVGKFADHFNEGDTKQSGNIFAAQDLGAGWIPRAIME